MISKTRISKTAKLIPAAVALLLSTAIPYPSPAKAQPLIPTPTLSETKTPTPPAEIPSAGTTVTTATPTETTAFTPLTQTDLSILTGNVQRPNGIVWHDDLLYAACTGDSTLYEIDSRTGQTRTYVGGIANAHTLYAETNSEGNVELWVPDFQRNALIRVLRIGQQETVVTDLAGPWGIAALDDQHFLITLFRGNSLQMISRDAEITSLLDGLASPTGIAIDGDIVYIANNGSTRRAIEWYDLTALDQDEENRVLVSGLQNTTGLQLGEDGLLYFAYALGTRGLVGRVDPTACRERGGCTNNEVEIVVYTELATPLAGLTLTPDGRIFLHTMFSPDIYWAQLLPVEDTVTDVSE
jgi:sugar lactone lactonase YvrE